MPAHAGSLRITDMYRLHLRALRARGVSYAREQWAALDPGDLDRSHAAWVQKVAITTTELQRAGARLSHAYLTAYLRSETRRPLAAVPVDLSAHVGEARSGRPLAEALVPTLFTVKQAIGDGKDTSAALTEGLNRAVRTVGEESIAPARESLAEGIRQEGGIVGWRRVTGGGCGACLAAATGAVQADDEVLEVHPFCQCSKEPVVKDAPDHVTRPTGGEIFKGLSAQEQDQLLGPDKAELIRSGAVPLQALIQRDPMVEVADGITEAPLEALLNRS
jgi:hypothetical protein